jgi:hypothetical protein
MSQFCLRAQTGRVRRTARCPSVVCVHVHVTCFHAKMKLTLLCLCVWIVWRHLGSKSHTSSQTRMMSPQRFQIGRCCLGLLPHVSLPSSSQFFFDQRLEILLFLLRLRYRWCLYRLIVSCTIYNSGAADEEKFFPSQDYGCKITDRCVCVCVCMHVCV